MNRKENALKRYLLRIMGTRWHVQSHEDKHSEGIPDLSYGVNAGNGWIELKQIDNYPLTETKIIKPKKYEPEQVNWINIRGRRSGRCYILVKIGKEDYYLFKWNMAKLIKDGMSLLDYKQYSEVYYKGSIDPDSLLWFLSRR